MSVEVFEAVRCINWHSDKLIQILRYLLQFIHSCQLYFYYYHHFLTHWGGKGDFAKSSLEQRVPKFSAEKRCKSGCVETHYHQKELLKKSYASMVVIGDSILGGLRRYPIVWKNFILQYKTINLRIWGDRIENVSWRINDTVLPKSVRSVVIHCGTDNINTSSSDEISLDAFTIARSISHRYQTLMLLLVVY